MENLKTTAAALLLLPLTIFIFSLLLKKFKNSKTLIRANDNLPPGPKKLPILGNLHQISLPLFRGFRDLAKQYGPIMHMKLGELDTIVVSSPEMAEEILKLNDPIFNDRPGSLAIEMFSYNYRAVTLIPYSEYWKQMRKLCMVELLSSKAIRSLASVRKEEVDFLVESLRLSAGEVVNMTEKVTSLISSIASTAVYGKICREKEKLIALTKEASESSFLIADIFPSSKIAAALSWGTKRRLTEMKRELDVILDDIIEEHERNRKESGRGGGDSGSEDLVDVLLRVKETQELMIPIGYDNIKAVIFDIFAAATETSASTIDWAMAELVRHPKVMAKAQAEVREVVKERGKIDTSTRSVEEEDISKLDYLKLVIMETLRFHPQASLIPRVSREPHRINGYTIPEKVKIMVNTWAIHRDPKYWDNPEVFDPERFLNQPTLDFNGNDFRYLPFGSGKRMCPGAPFASPNLALPLANLLYSFDWKLPPGVRVDDLDMIESSAISSFRKENLFAIATPYQP